MAGENDDVHMHWVEGIGNAIIRDYSNQDGDQIIIRGHTVEIASITYGEDEGGDFSLVTLRSQQGNGGAGGANTATGAHDEDPLGSIKIYGDKVTENDIKVQAAGVFDGVDKLETIGASPETYVITQEAIDAGNQDFDGTNRSDTILLGSGQQTVEGDAGWDRIISYADAGEPDPAQTEGSEGRVTDPVPAGSRRSGRPSVPHPEVPQHAERRGVRHRTGLGQDQRRARHPQRQVAADPADR